MELDWWQKKSALLMQLSVRACVKDEVIEKEKNV